jgi:flavorubredoxin
MSPQTLFSPIVRPRDVQVAPIGINTIAMRSRTWERLKFEVEYARQRGTTANSYLIQSDKTALIDPPGESFTQIYLQQLRQHLDLTSLDYIIVGHVNPNRMATLKILLDEATHAKLICSKPGSNRAFGRYFRLGERTPVAIYYRPDSAMGRRTLYLRPRNSHSLYR